MMSNGYKPAPLDLSDVKLLPPQEILVDKLAENAHNVWAKDRIKQGWTYGIQQVRRVRSSMLEKQVWLSIKMSFCWRACEIGILAMPLHSISHGVVCLLFIESWTR